MARLRPAARALLLFVVLGGAAALLGWALAGYRAGDGDVKITLAEPRALVLMAECVALGVVAQHFSIPTSPNHKVAISDAAFLAGLLLFGAPVGTLLVGVGELIGQSTLMLRGLRGRISILFNTGQLSLSMGLAGLAYHALPSPWELPIAAVVWYLTNTWLVAVMSGLQFRLSLRDMLDLWSIGRRQDAMQVAGLVFMAWLMTRSAIYDPWVLLLMLVPGAVVYLSMQRSVQLAEQTIEAVETLADVVDERDRYTFQHSKRVSAYAEQIARALRLPREQVETIRLAARVHDLGKVGIPDEVLHKPGKLEPDEWELMQQHAEKGYHILSRFPTYRDGRELVRAHHERWDGKGYPRRLKGDAIQLGAQIIAVADTFDAMTSDRPYRRALPVAVALAELANGKGAQWHAEVVQAALRALTPAPAPATPAAPTPAPTPPSPPVQPASTPVSTPVPAAAVA